MNDMADVVVTTCGTLDHDIARVLADYYHGDFAMDDALLREEGEKHLVKTFDSVDKSVQSYFINLNSHHAYSDFRKVRKIMREKNNFNNIYF